MFEILNAFLCHDITADGEPVVLRPDFYDTDPFVVIFLSLRLGKNVNFKLTFQWEHDSGFNTTSETEVEQSSGNLNMYSYMSPTAIRTLGLVDPSGYWRLTVSYLAENLIDVKFLVQHVAWLGEPTILDLRA